MSSPGESVEQAEADYNTFVSMNEEAATKDQVDFWVAGNTGYSDKALAELAAALHAVVDSTSPTHRRFQVWNWKNPRLVANHVLGGTEKRIFWIGSRRSNFSSATSLQQFCECLPVPRVWAVAVPPGYRPHMISHMPEVRRFLRLRWLQALVARTSCLSFSSLQSQET